MIVELFGPPGAGKTTLAHALADRLGAQGYRVRTVLSGRSNVLTRSAAKVLMAPFAWTTAVARGKDPSALMGLLPPQDWIWSLRMRRYLLALSAAWVADASCGEIVLFDQGFAQAICSLALLSGILDRSRIADALRSVPQPDLLVSLDAPNDVLESRLRGRLAGYSRIGRLLELDLQSSLRLAEVTGRVADLIDEQSLPRIRCRSLSPHQLDEAIDEIAPAIVAKLGSKGIAAPPDRRRAITSPRRTVRKVLNDRTASYEVATKQRYQNESFARSYLNAYAGRPKLSTLAARIIAARERHFVAQALSTCQPPPAMLLDLPCGTGKLADVLLATGCDVFAADISMEMMALAEAPYGRSDRFRGFTQCDAAQMTFPDASFDTVVCLRLMHRIPPDLRRQITSELARVASRRVIVSYGIVDGIQAMRLRVRERLTGGISAPHPATYEQISQEIAAAGLTLTAAFSILPVLSCERLFVLEKQQTPAASSQAVQQTSSRPSVGSGAMQP